MEFVPPLQSACLIKRYKRFLADVRTATGDVLTLHCANTGAMTGCATPGDTVWYSASLSATRRYPHSWELSQTAQGDLVCVNTLRANSLVYEALIANRLSALANYQIIRREVKSPGANSRFDFLLTGDGLADCYLEVKSMTLAHGQQGYFPDAVTERGQKHLRELMQVAARGQRAVLLFAVLHPAITCVAAAAHIDPCYADLLAQAQDCGVQVLAYKADISLQQMRLSRQLPLAG